MSSGGESIDIFGRNVKTRNYYAESRRLRTEVMSAAEALKGKPMRFAVTNGIFMNVEISKSDLKTIVSKNTKDNKFNAFKNALAKDIKGFIKKGKYEGWREVIEGKHSEAAYFAYNSRSLGNAKAYLCLRKMKDTGLFKPYAIIDHDTFVKEIGHLKKGKPPR